MYNYNNNNNNSHSAFPSLGTNKQSSPHNNNHSSNLTNGKSQFPPLTPVSKYGFTAPPPMPHSQNKSEVSLFPPLDPVTQRPINRNSYDTNVSNSMNTADSITKRQMTRNSSDTTSSNSVDNPNPAYHPPKPITKEANPYIAPYNKSSISNVPTLSWREQQQQRERERLSEVQQQTDELMQIRQNHENQKEEQYRNRRFLTQTVSTSPSALQSNSAFPQFNHLSIPTASSSDLTTNGSLSQPNLMTQSCYFCTKEPNSSSQLTFPIIPSLSTSTESNIPNKPQKSVASTVPTAPKAPTAPTVPTAPKASTASTAPKAPTAPTFPTNTLDPIINSNNATETINEDEGSDEDLEDSIKGLQDSVHENEEQTSHAAMLVKLYNRFQQLEQNKRKCVRQVAKDAQQTMEEMAETREKIEDYKSMIDDLQKILLGQTPEAQARQKEREEKRQERDEKRIAELMKRKLEREERRLKQQEEREERRRQVEESRQTRDMKK